MTSPFLITAELELLSTVDGGLREPMPAPTPSLLLVFPNLDPEAVQEDLQIGAMISGPPTLVPGTAGPAELRFWDDLGRVYAIPGADFKLWYAGRIVGSGTISSDQPEADP